VADFPEHVVSQEKVAEDLNMTGTDDLSPSEILAAVKGATEAGNSNHVYQDALNGMFRLGMFANSQSRGPRFVLINDRKLPVVDSTKDRWS